MTTKILALTESLGNLVDFRLLPGRAHDLRAVPESISDLTADHLLADQDPHGPVRATGHARSRRLGSRNIAKAVLQLIMEADVDGLIGAGRHKRSSERTIWRNGYRDRALDTRLGTLNLRVPKLRQGSYFPGFIEARKTSARALVAGIQEALISGVSTRRVDELVQAMRLNGSSKSTVSKLCNDIDERVGAFPNRPLTCEWPVRHWARNYTTLTDVTYAAWMLSQRVV